MQGVLEILKEALVIEREGEEFYRAAAENCKNPVAKHTFLSLAEQERKHAAYFHAHYEALAAGRQWPALEDLDVESYEVPDEAKAIYDQARCEAESCDVVMCAELEQLYATAMDKERRSLELYRHQAEQAQDEQQKAFFAFLIEQERGHLEVLSNTHKYLDDPAQWFFDQEQWIVEG